jgi:hypothetical protein
MLAVLQQDLQHLIMDLLAVVEVVLEVLVLMQQVHHQR